jgi:dipeptidase E
VRCMSRALLISNSTLPGRAPLDHCLDEIRDFLGRQVERVLFVPFALADRDAYTTKMRASLERAGVAVDSLHTATDACRAIAAAQAVFVGGGNTFRLLRELQQRSLLVPLREQIESGVPYLGSSAGSNLACPTIMTTNDMPIVPVQDFQALGLVPFQINPHYQDPIVGSTHMGETREQRIREYLEENERVVVGLREGAWLRVEGAELGLGGTSAARIFRRGHEPEEVSPPARLDRLLAAQSS